MPKSMIRASSCASTMMLAGFKSRWTTPASCAARSPDTTPRTRSVQRSGMPSDAPSVSRIVARSRPSTYDIVMYLMPSISPRSWMRTTLLWVTSRASSSSRLKRRSTSRAVYGIARDLRPDHLERDRHPQLRVPRLIDDAHPAGAQHTDDVVAGAERFAWNEQPVLVSVPARSAACVVPVNAGGRRRGHRQNRPGRSRTCRHGRLGLTPARRPGSFRPRRPGAQAASRHRSPVSAVPSRPHRPGFPTWCRLTASLAISRASSRRRRCRTTCCRSGWGRQRVVEERPSPGRRAASAPGRMGSGLRTRSALCRTVGKTCSKGPRPEGRVRFRHIMPLKQRPSQRRARVFVGARAPPPRVQRAGRPATSIAAASRRAPDRAVRPNRGEPSASPLRS